LKKFTDLNSDQVNYQIKQIPLTAIEKRIFKKQLMGLDGKISIQANKKRIN